MERQGWSNLRLDFVEHLFPLINIGESPQFFGYYDANTPGWYLPVAFAGNLPKDVIQSVEAVCKNYGKTGYKKCELLNDVFEIDEYNSLQCSLQRHDQVTCTGGPSHWYRSGDDQIIFWNPKYGRGGGLSAFHSSIQIRSSVRSIRLTLWTDCSWLLRARRLLPLRSTPLRCETVRTT